MKAFPTRIFAASALALLIAGCGGSGDEPLPADTADTADPAPTAPTADTRQPPGTGLALSGTAATGLAMGDSSVDVKCATGTATATTDGSGRYTLTMTDGALPCMVKVTGTVNGASVTLHSLVETGTMSNGVTTVVANVTPLTEMIVAQMAAKLPSELFASFGTGSTVTAEQLKTATDAVLGVLKDVAGVDLEGIDPFKAPLVVATDTDPAGGNTHDQRLDALGDIFPLGSLAVVTSQIATASATDSASGGTGTAGLTQLVTSVNSGAMPGCTVVTSGDYRSIEYFGATRLNNIDFMAMKFTPGGSQVAGDIQPLETAKPCEFVALVGTGSAAVQHHIVMGRAGAGAFRAASLADQGTVVGGHIFPVQQGLSADELAGEWTVIESGEFGSSGLGYATGRLTINVNGSSGEICSYPAGENPPCVDPVAITVAARSDGGVDLSTSMGNMSTEFSRFYGFRAPNGSITLYGTSNPSGAAQSPTTYRTTIVGARRDTLDLPVVNAVYNYWDLIVTATDTEMAATLAPESITVTAVDRGLVSYTRASNGRPEQGYYNVPFAGLRSRNSGTYNGVAYSEAMQIPLPSGVAVSVNTSGSTHFYVISPLRP